MTMHVQIDSTLTSPKELTDLDQALDYVADLLARDALKAASEGAHATLSADAAGIGTS